MTKPQNPEAAHLNMSAELPLLFTGNAT